MAICTHLATIMLVDMRGMATIRRSLMRHLSLRHQPPNHHDILLAMGTDNPVVPGPLKVIEPVEAPRRMAMRMATILTAKGLMMNGHLLLDPCG
jgi:hypothetical protein